MSVKGYIVATDQLGSIISVADLSGNNVQEVLYDSFGGKILDSNPDLSQPLGFAGGLYDPDTNLIHFGYREYDPTIGRFISPDPLGYEGGDVDLYGYCTDDPVNFMDCSGLAGSSEAGEDEKAETSNLSKRLDESGVDPQAEIISVKGNKADKKTKPRSNDRPAEEAGSHDSPKQKKADAEKSEPVPEEDKSSDAEPAARESNEKEDEGGFWSAVTKMGRGTADALSRAADTLSGDGDDYIKFAKYVSPEKRKIFNNMMSEAKEVATDKGLNGFMKYGPAGLGLGLAGGSLGMLKGLVGAILDNKKTKNEAAKKVKENFLEQRQDTEKHLDNFKKHYRK